MSVGDVHDNDECEGVGSNRKHDHDDADRKTGKQAALVTDLVPPS